MNLNIRNRLHRAIESLSTPEMLRSIAMLLFAASSVIAVGVVYKSKVDEHNRGDRLQSALDAKTAVDTCRAQVGSAVTDATTTYLFSLGQVTGGISFLVDVLANRGDSTFALDQLHSANQELTRAGVVLDAARDARVAFEAKPTGGCSGDHPVVETTPPRGASSPLTTGTSTAVTTSPITVKLRRATTTTRAPGTTATTQPGTSSTRPPAPTTTAKPTPLCDLIPNPVTVPPMVPCL